MELDYDAASMRDWAATSDDLEDVLAYAGMVAQDYWRTHSIIDTSLNSRSVHVETGLKDGVLQAAVVAFASYSFWREFGGRNRPEHVMRDSGPVVAAEFGGTA